MSWLARELGLSFDLFESLMTGRERQTAWIAAKTRRAAQKTKLPIVVLGRSFKPETSIVTGSPALLLLHMLRESGEDPLSWDPFIDGPSHHLDEPAVFVIATRHPIFGSLRFPAGSEVIDPWGIVEDQDSLTVQRLGREKTRITHAALA
jgi:UDPglucose 6-dehydrogenase